MNWTNKGLYLRWHENQKGAALCPEENATESIPFLVAKDLLDGLAETFSAVNNKQQPMLVTQTSLKEPLNELTAYFEPPIKFQLKIGYSRKVELKHGKKHITLQAAYCATRDIIPQ